MKIILEGESKEIADFISEVQSRPKGDPFEDMLSRIVEETRQNKAQG